MGLQLLHYDPDARGWSEELPPIIAEHRLVVNLVTPLEVESLHNLNLVPSSCAVMSVRNKSATKSNWTATAKVDQTEIALSIPN